MQVSVWFEHSIARNVALVASIRGVCQEFGPYAKWIGHYTGVNVQRLSWHQAFTFAAKISAIFRAFGADAPEYVRIDVKKDQFPSTFEETKAAILAAAERKRADQERQGDSE